MSSGKLKTVLIFLFLLHLSGEAWACLPGMPISPRAGSYQDPAELSLVRIAFRKELTSGGPSQDMQKIANIYLNSCWAYGGRYLWWSTVNVNVAAGMIRPIRNYFVSLPTQNVGEFFADLDKSIPLSLRSTFQFEHSRLEEPLKIRIQRNEDVLTEDINPWNLVDPVKGWIRKPYCREKVTVIVERPSGRDWQLALLDAEMDPTCPKRTDVQWWMFWKKWFS